MLSKNFNSIMLTALISSLFIGCSATKPEAVNNQTLSNNYLYASLNKNYKIKELSNKHNTGRSFIVNNYQPFGFDDKFYEVDRIGNCLWLQKGTVNSKYETIENEMSGGVAFMNILLLPLTLPFGLMCGNYHAFDYQEFDDDIKELLPPSDSKKLVSKYDTLLENEHTTENKLNNETDTLNKNVDKLNNKISKLNESSIQKLNTIKSKYLAIDIGQIQKNVKTIDKTSLYHNEKLPLDLKIYNNDFPKPNLLQEFDHFSYLQYSKYSKIVDDSFPCNTVSGCISNIDNSIVSIQNEYPNDVKLIHQQKQLEREQWQEKQQQHIKQLKEDTKEYIRLSKFHNVQNNLKDSVVQVNKNGITKKIFYTVDIKSSKLLLNEKLLSTVTVRDINYSDVFPKYSNKDKNIKIEFYTYSHKIKNTNDTVNIQEYELVNNTNKFVQIKSISLYYDGSIYNLTLNKNNNVFATELSPQSTRIFTLYDAIKESNYVNVTKKQAQQKSFKFGFAIKYTTGKQTNNITLYGQHKYNLYSLIKDI